MNMKLILGTLTLAAVIVVGAYIVVARPIGLPEPKKESEVVGCTRDAKICPDGSAVGRTGPNCEFAQCRTPTGDDTIRITTKINQGAGRPGIEVIPVELLEDSRCPVDVQCIQAGTVRVRAQLISDMGISTDIFTLGSFITTENEKVTLVEVLPAPNSQVALQPSQYQFIFELTPHNQ